MPGGGPAPIQLAPHIAPRPNTPYTGCWGSMGLGIHTTALAGRPHPYAWAARYPKFLFGLPQGLFPRRLGTHAGAFALTSVKGGDHPTGHSAGWRQGGNPQRRASQGGGRCPGPWGQPWVFPSKGY